MNALRVIALPFAFFLLFVAGCGTIDTNPSPTGDKILEGVVSYRSASALPDNSLLTVRLLNETHLGKPPQVLAERTIIGVAASPVRYSIECKAEDIMPPNRVRLEARISVNGKLRYFSMNSVAVTPAKAERPIDLWLEAMER